MDSGHLGSGLLGASAWNVCTFRKLTGCWAPGLCKLLPAEGAIQPCGTSWPWATSELGVNKWQSWRTRVTVVQPLLGHNNGLWSPASRFFPCPESPVAFRAPHQSAPPWLLSTRSRGCRRRRKMFTVSLLCGRPCSKPLTVTKSSLPHPTPEKPGVLWWSGTLGASGHEIRRWLGWGLHRILKPACTGL